MRLMQLRRSSSRALSFPGEEYRETWLCDANETWRRVDHAVDDGVMALEAIAFDSAPFWSLNHEQASDEAVALRWESFGLTNASGSRLWLHWPVMRKGKQGLVGTLALAAESSLPNWRSYEPSVRMLSLPSNGIAMWKEMGRHVVAFTRENRLLHLAVLTARVLDADAAFELRDLSAALQVHEFMDEVAAIHVWARSETDFGPQLACLFDSAVVIKEPRPDPRPPAEASGLLPAQVAAQRQQQIKRHNQLLIIAAAALVYLAFFGSWWLRLQWRESQMNQADALMIGAQPLVDRVREAQTRWQEMETAINPDLYPVELFHQIVSLLPDEGIRLKEFQIDRDKLILSGEATTVNQALGFKDRLAACEPLQRYTWSFPVPSIREDNRAEFRAEGTLNGGGTVHEGQ